MGVTSLPASQVASQETLLQPVCQGHIGLEAGLTLISVPVLRGAQHTLTMEAFPIWPVCMGGCGKGVGTAPWFWLLGELPGAGGRHRAWTVVTTGFRKV